MAWQTPKTDRTSANKGYLHYDVLNRIENNCEYIAQLLNVNLIPVTITVKTNWTAADFPFLTQINRIRANVNALKTAYYHAGIAPEIIIHNTLDWIDANTLEQNLLNINTLLQNMIAAFKYSGTFAAGQEVYI